MTRCLPTFKLALLILCLATVAQAFPPAPYYTLYGTVRDQTGNRISNEGAVLVLIKGGVEISRTTINSTVRLDQNYEMNIRLDQNRSGTSLYNDKAVIAQGLFSLVVEMNGSLFYPIEVNGSLTAGKGGERIKLDLNLGEDLDHDGLPDIWEQWQLYQAGYYPDENGNWPINLIDKNGDFDHDGQNNWLEYLAGTFAADSTDHFQLAVKERLASSVRLEFYAITGKVYTIERSSDLKTWARVPFAVETGTASDNYTATDVGIVSAFTTPLPDNKEFYRLTVR